MDSDAASWSQQLEAVRQIEPHLMAEDRQRARAGVGRPAPPLRSTCCIRSRYCASAGYLGGDSSAAGPGDTTFRPVAKPIAAATASEPRISLASAMTETKNPQNL